MEYKASWLLVSERVVKFWPLFISFFAKIVIGDVPGQNLCNFLSAVLEKVAVVNLNNILKN